MRMEKINDQVSNTGTMFNSQVWLYSSINLKIETWLLKVENFIPWSKSSDFSLPKNPKKQSEVCISQGPRLKS